MVLFVCNAHNKRVLKKATAVKIRSKGGGKAKPPKAPRPPLQAGTPWE